MEVPFVDRHNHFSHLGVSGDSMPTSLHPVKAPRVDMKNELKKYVWTLLIAGFSTLWRCQLITSSLSQINGFNLLSHLVRKEVSLLFLSAFIYRKDI
eukprot:scaffold3263_cov128-Skeletonema_menzelii.AAC.3